MREFADRVAVITGAANGIGRGMAEQFAAVGMRVALADCNEAALHRTARSLRAQGASILAVATDVSDPEQVHALADQVYSTYGATDVLCNNAGVTAPDLPIWDIPLDEWARILSVNLHGVLHGVHVFAPRMQAQGTDGHIVNTASVAGLGSRPGLSPYYTSKHAVISLTESLHHELTAARSRIKASVLCPGRIPTGLSAHTGVLVNAHHVTAADVGTVVLEGIRAERFYLFTHPVATQKRIRDRARDMTKDRPPTRSRPLF